MSGYQTTWEHDVWEMLSPGAKLNYFRDYKHVIIAFPGGVEKKAVALIAPRNFANELSPQNKQMLINRGIPIIIKEENPNPSDDELFDEWPPATESSGAKEEVILAKSQPEAYDIPDETPSFDEWYSNTLDEIGF